MLIHRWVPLWALPFLISFSLGTVWLRLTIVGISYRISETEKAIQRARQEKELLQVKLAELRSPKRLEMMARTQFQLKPPQMNQVIYLKPNTLEKD